MNARPRTLIGTGAERARLVVDEVMTRAAVVDALAATPSEGLPALRMVGMVHAKGRNEPVAVHTLLA